MLILGIETSCDETAVCLLEVRKGKPHVLKNIIASQIDIHKITGGVVPEVAARNHVLTMIPVLAKGLGKRKPQFLAVTAGPGLITSLLVGVQTAQILSYAWDIPLIGVNRIEGHLYASWLAGKPYTFPALALIVSGGHTELILIKKQGVYEYLGKTLDDAAGEAFDKVAKILDLGYPGGPIISKLAEKGNSTRFPLPRPMIDHDNFNFSFSGLKTAVLYLVRDLKKGKKFSQKIVPDICASFQQAVVDVLVKKTLRAAQEYNVKMIVLGGGVVANIHLRKTLQDECKKQLPDVACFVPSLQYCTDNAAMIAAAAYFHSHKNKSQSWRTVKADPGMVL